MQTVVESHGSVKDHMAGLYRILASALRECPCCGGPLIGHGRRRRWVVSLQGVLEILIQRMICKACRRTFSLLPRMLYAFRQCARSLVARIRFLWEPGLRSMADVRHMLVAACPSLASRLSLPSLYRWAAHTT